LCNSKVNELSRKTSDLIGKRIAARLHSESTKFAFGQDPIGDLIDAIDRKEPGIAARIKTSGLFSLFRRLYRIPETEKKVVVFDGSINCLALFDRGNVLVSDIGKGGMIVDSLRLLSKTLCTKADIVMRIWGYTYHPFKHDPLVYRLTSRLRDSLGSRSDWLKYTENGYILDAVFVSLENCDDSTSKMVADSNGFLSTAPRSFSRPQMILDLARQLGGVLTSKIVSQRLGCAEITARRDLHSLLKEGKLERLGNGRSTQYQLVNNIMKGNHQ